MGSWAQCPWGIMALGKRNPFEELEQLFDRMNRQFEQSAEGMDSGMWGMKSMSVDIEDREDEFVVTADLPGFDKEDMSVKLADNQLKIKAEREEHVEEGEEGEYIRRERSQRSTSRSVSLPEPVDEEGVEARYKNGVLTVTLQKVHAASESRDIEIN